MGLPDIRARWVSWYGLQYPYGECQCGCGELAPIAQRSRSSTGTAKGHPMRFILNHDKRPHDPFVVVRKYTPTGLDRDSCWEWKGYIGKNGYGQLKHKCETLHAHRMSYRLHYGEIPNGLYVCHHCDNPKCVNPNHLFLGDAQTNKSDCVTKHRHAAKESHGRSSLKECEVQNIRDRRKDGELLSSLSSEFGVSETQISRICLNKQWKVSRAQMEKWEAENE